MGKLVDYIAFKCLRMIVLLVKWITVWCIYMQENISIYFTSLFIEIHPGHKEGNIMSQALELLFFYIYGSLLIGRPNSTI